MATLYFRSDGWVKTSQGPAVAGAQIYVCNQPADTSDIPPTPLAAIYSDPNGLFLITQPILTDGFGHYDFYAASGTYALVVAYGGALQQVYPDQTVGAVVASGILINNSVITNPNFNNTLPVPPAGYQNVSWQTAGGYVSACVPIGGGGGGVSVEVNGGAFSSSTTLNFVNSTSVLFSDLGSGRLSAAVSLPSAGNIVNTFWSTQSGNITANVALIANTAWEQIPANAILISASSWYITITSTAGTQVSNCGVARTLPNSLAIIDWTLITFGGSSSVTIGAGAYVKSDAISLPIDTQHDYWFAVYGPYPQTNYALDGISSSPPLPFIGFGTGGAGTVDYIGTATSIPTNQSTQKSQWLVSWTTN